jgi:hypothetical protein
MEWTKTRREWPQQLGDTIVVFERKSQEAVMRRVEAEASGRN